MPHRVFVDGYASSFPAFDVRAGSSNIHDYLRSEKIMGLGLSAQLAGSTSAVEHPQKEVRIRVQSVWKKSLLLSRPNAENYCPKSYRLDDMSDCRSHR